jgi:hypothetical protein
MKKPYGTARYPDEFVASGDDNGVVHAWHLTRNNWMFRITFPGKVAIRGLRFHSFSANSDIPQVGLSVFTEHLEARKHIRDAFSGELHTFVFKLPGQEIQDKLGTAGQDVEDEDDTDLEISSRMVNEIRIEALNGSISGKTLETRTEQGESVRPTVDEIDMETWRMDLVELREAIAKRGGIADDARTELLGMVDRMYSPHMRPGTDTLEPDSMDGPVQMASEQGILRSHGEEEMELEPASVRNPVTGMGECGPVQDQLWVRGQCGPLESEARRFGSEPSKTGNGPILEPRQQQESVWTTKVPLEVQEVENERVPELGGMEDGEGFDNFGEFH